MTWMKKGNTAVATGAAGGIGLEAARRFAAAGMNVVLVDLKEDALKNAPNCSQFGATRLAL